MHYLAVIKYNLTDSYCKSFDSEKEAATWLDSNNNNLDCPTFIDVYDDKWVKVGSITHTEGNKPG